MDEADSFQWSCVFMQPLILYEEILKNQCGLELRSSFTIRKECEK